jgi:L-iditol 2-dehydrogenase
VKACSICGTDVRTFHSGKANVKPPQIIGHELAGQIEEIGENVKNFKKGDRISVAPIVSCGLCYYCTRGLQNLCANFTAIGYEYPGGFAEYMAVPAQLLQDGSVNLIPENLSYDEAALAEPFACALNAEELAKTGLGDNVVVVGAGPIGCMHIAIARAMGATKVILIELTESRLEMAKKFVGAEVYINPAKEDAIARVKQETNGRGADVIMVAAPSGKAQEDAIKMVAYRGRVCLFGGLPKAKPFIQLDSNLVHYKECFIHGSSGSLPRHNQIALGLFSTGAVKAKNFITHRFPLEGILDGIKVVETGAGLKVVVNP